MVEMPRDEITAVIRFRPWWTEIDGLKVRHELVEIRDLVDEAVNETREQKRHQSGVLAFSRLETLRKRAKDGRAEPLSDDEKKFTATLAKTLLKEIFDIEEDIEPKAKGKRIRSWLTKRR